jgi:hypothetical protein
MKEFRKHPWFIGMILATGTTFACGDSTRDVDGNGAELVEDEDTRLIEGAFSNLTAEEMREFQVDREYMRSLAQPNQAVRLNLADPQQHRLAMARLKIAGKSRFNSPNLFTVVEQTRQEHVRRGYGTGLVAELEFRDGGSDREAMHFISTATVDGQEGEGAASSTFPDGSLYTFLDVAYFDIEGLPVAAPNVVEDFGGGADVNVQTDADLTQSDIDAYTVDTLKMEDTGADFIVSYTYTEMGLQSAQPAAGRPTPPVLSVQNVLAPIDTRLNDDLISICLNRVWTQDCDYDLTGNPQAVKVPLQGSIVITSTAHVFSQQAIDDIKANPVNHARAGYVKLLLAQAGGGCDVGADGALSSSMQAFWDSVTVSPDQKTLSWNMTGANSAFFDDGCRQVQDDVFLTMRLQLPVRDAGLNLDYWVSKTLSNNPNQFAPDFVYDRMEMTNSCLAEGTMLQMADGSLVAVEDVAAGTHVFNTVHDGAQGLTVTDTAVGVETEPMVRLVAEGGREVLMTEMHPVQTPDRGIVLAKELQEGDLVATVDGLRVLSRVSREEYEGKVYNVKLGTELEKAALDGEDLTLVYANGFLVGDGQVQRKYESIAAAEPMQGDVLDRLPSQWHLDYHLSPVRRQ